MSIVPIFSIMQELILVKDCFQNFFEFFELTNSFIRFYLFVFINKITRLTLTYNYHYFVYN